MGKKGWNRLPRRVKEGRESNPGEHKANMLKNIQSALLSNIAVGTGIIK